MRVEHIGDATLYLGDCLDYMRDFPDKAFELAIVDPEYGIKINHNIGRRKGDRPSDYKPAYWDKSPPPLGVLRRAYARI